ncbi:hypothetical protein HMPREF9124_1248 [Oribacterium sp. oral taxon 108 str. F0425]|nr:hypothetical protein HMPREF9124_1248 [Oribacterium sp. oral taxon 108 str. F0425]
MIQWFRQKNYAKEITLMDIVALLEVLVKGLLDAEEDDTDEQDQD